jgi:hypothetical protein
MEFLKSVLRQLLGRQKTCEARLNDQATQIEGLIAKQNELEQKIRDFAAPQAVDLSAINEAITEIKGRTFGLTPAQSLLLSQSLAVKDEFAALDAKVAAIQEGFDSLKDLLDAEPADVEIPKVNA